MQIYNSNYKWYVRCPSLKGKLFEYNWTVEANCSLQLKVHIKKKCPLEALNHGHLHTGQIITVKLAIERKKQ